MIVSDETSSIRGVGGVGISMPMFPPATGESWLPRGPAHGCLRTWSVSVLNMMMLISYGMGTSGRRCDAST
jgi:hypothetical protein